MLTGFVLADGSAGPETLEAARVDIVSMGCFWPSSRLSIADLYSNSAEEVAVTTPIYKGGRKI